MEGINKFTNKAVNYRKYRPEYPDDFFDYLVNLIKINKESIVADIGAGTGILTKRISQISKLVYAVEPNESMRKECKSYCDENNVYTLNGCAENTSLVKNSIDFITVAQSLHWFDIDKARIEFKRILKDDGKTILVWNSRDRNDEFIKEYFEILHKMCPEFKGFSGGVEFGTDKSIDFFKNQRCEHKVFLNKKFETLETFVGGSLSASYAPNKGDDNYNEFIKSIKDIFIRFSVNDRVMINYNTNSYVGMP
ncbi:MAG: class I SAM-dependent methyltransferase [Clostridiales bacterium]